MVPKILRDMDSMEVCKQHVSLKLQIKAAIRMTKIQHLMTSMLRIVSNTEPWLLVVGM